MNSKESPVEKVLLKLIGEKVNIRTEDVSTDGILATIVTDKRYFFLIHPFCGWKFNYLFTSESVEKIVVGKVAEIITTILSENIQ